MTDTISLRLKGEQYRAMVGEVPDDGTCQIDESITPHRMVIHGTGGPNSGKTFRAIFDFPAPRKMRVCYDLSGTEYPAAFESTEANSYYLAVYTREE